MKKWIVLLSVFLTAFGWQQTEGLYKGKGFNLDLPKGWMRHTDSDESLIATMDGEALQNIRFNIIHLEEQDKDNKKAFKKGMLPEETAQIVIDLMKSSLIQFALVENVPAQIGGMDGFRLVFTYRNSNVRYRSVYYGALQDQTYYRLSYNAPVRYYFERDLNAFEACAKSFTVVPVPPEQRATKNTSIFGAGTEM